MAVTVRIPTAFELTDSAPAEDAPLEATEQPA
jgi:hypothetical protein